MFGLIISLNLAVESASHAAQLPTYSARVVSPRPGNSVVYATAVNDLGDFCGWEANWKHTKSTYFMLDHVSGYHDLKYQCTAINNRAEYIGQTPSGPYFFSPIKGYFIIRPPIGFGNAVANGLNNDGVVVGTVTSADGSDARAFAWTQSGGMSVMAGEKESHGDRINDRGDIAISALSDRWGAFHAGLYVDGLRRTIDSETTTTEPTGINGSDQMALGPYAYYWSPSGGFQRIYGMTEAKGISDSGWVAGNDGSVELGMTGMLWNEDFALKAMPLMPQIVKSNKPIWHSPIVTSSSPAGVLAAYVDRSEDGCGFFRPCDDAVILGPVPPGQ